MPVTEWHKLNHAYGDAGDIRGLLDDLSPNPSAKVWDELWSRVCHQGTIYSASYPVLPYLLRAVSQWTPTNRIMPLFLAGSIVSSDDRVRVGDTAAFGPTVEALHRLAVETLTTAQGLSTQDLIYLLQATLALAGDRTWGRQLDRLAGGEFEGVCQACNAQLYLVVGEYGFFTTASEWVNRPATPRVPILPADPSALPETGRWLHEQATRASQPVLADWICHLFGSTQCPKCGAAIDVAEAATRAV
jgi:hypothetical protein